MKPFSFKQKNKIYLLLVVPILLMSCGKSIQPEPSGESKGYVLYVFAKRTELMIDYSKMDGISRGTKLDVFKMNAPNMNEPVKLGEIVVEKVGDKMSKARVVVINSSLKMEIGDRVFPHPITVVTDDTWISHTNPEKGWKSEYSLPNERSWVKCQIIDRLTNKPAVRQLMTDTNAKPIWYPNITAPSDDIFFRKVFQINADIVSAELKAICGGRANIYINDTWIGEIREPKYEEMDDWPKIESYKIKSFLRKGKNLIAVQVFRDQRTTAPPALIMSIEVQTTFR